MIRKYRERVTNEETAMGFCFGYAAGLATGITIAVLGGLLLSSVYASLLNKF